MADDDCDDWPDDIEHLIAQHEQKKHVISQQQPNSGGGQSSSSGMHAQHNPWAPALQLHNQQPQQQLQPGHQLAIAAPQQPPLPLHGSVVARQFVGGGGALPLRDASNVQAGMPPAAQHGQQQRCTPAMPHDQARIWQAQQPAATGSHPQNPPHLQLQQVLDQVMEDRDACRRRIEVLEREKSELMHRAGLGGRPGLGVGGAPSQAQGRDGVHAAVRQQEVAQMRKQLEDKQRELEFARLEKAEASRSFAERGRQLREAEDQLLALRRQVEIQLADAAQRQLEVHSSTQARPGSGRVKRGSQRLSGAAAGDGGGGGIGIGAHSNATDVHLIITDAGTHGMVGNASEALPRPLPSPLPPPPPPAPVAFEVAGAAGVSPAPTTVQHSGAQAGLLPVSPPQVTCRAQAPLHLRTVVAAARRSLLDKLWVVAPPAMQVLMQAQPPALASPELAEIQGPWAAWGNEATHSSDASPLLGCAEAARLLRQAQQDLASLAQSPLPVPAAPSGGHNLRHGDPELQRRFRGLLSGGHPQPAEQQCVTSLIHLTRHLAMHAPNGALRAAGASLSHTRVSASLALLSDGDGCGVRGSNGDNHVSAAAPAGTANSTAHPALRTSITLCGSLTRVCGCHVLPWDGEKLQALWKSRRQMAMSAMQALTVLLQHCQAPERLLLDSYGTHSLAAGCAAGAGAGDSGSGGGATCMDMDIDSDAPVVALPCESTLLDMLLGACWALLQSCGGSSGGSSSSRGRGGECDGQLLSVLARTLSQAASQLPPHGSRVRMAEVLCWRLGAAEGSYSGNHSAHDSQPSSQQLLQGGSNVLLLEELMSHLHITVRAASLDLLCQLLECPGIAAGLQHVVLTAGGGVQPDHTGEVAAAKLPGIAPESIQQLVLAALECLQLDEDAGGVGAGGGQADTDASSSTHAAARATSAQPSHPHEWPGCSAGGVRAVLRGTGHVSAAADVAASASPQQNSSMQAVRQLLQLLRSLSQSSNWGLLLAMSVVAVQQGVPGLAQRLQAVADAAVRASWPGCLGGSQAWTRLDVPANIGVPLGELGTSMQARHSSSVGSSGSGGGGFGGVPPGNVRMRLQALVRVALEAMLLLKLLITNSPQSLRLALVEDLVVTPGAQHALHNSAQRLLAWPGAVLHSSGGAQHTWPALPLAAWARPHITSTTASSSSGLDLTLDQCLEALQQLAGGVYAIGKAQLSQQQTVAAQ